MADRPHAPSQARALAQEAKRGGAAGPLAERARRIDDPYHAAWALVHVAAFCDLDFGRADKLVVEALRDARKVPEAWRRAELVAEMARILLGEGLDARLRDAAQDRLLEAVASLEGGPAVATALQALAPRFARPRQVALLAEARRGGAALEAGKSIVAAWAQAGPLAPGEAEAILEALAGDPDAATAARLLGHLHLQARRARLPLPVSALDAAVAAASRVPAEEARTETLRLLALDASDVAELGRLRDAAPPPASSRGRLLSALAAQADRLGDPATAAAWFREAGAAAQDVPDAKARASLRRNVAQGLRRLGNAEEADGMDRQAAADRQAQAGATPTPPAPAPVAASGLPAPSRGTRPLLALHNAYDGGLAKPHLQALARAAPLAAGFGFDLVLVGFPAEDAAELVRRGELETQVGEGRGLATRLLAEGRILLVPRDVHGQPHRWGVADHYVATTQDPDPAKPTDLAALARSGRLCVVMGLGSRGLPRQLLDAAPHHLELTGAGVPLETATVMGVLAERLASLAR